MFGVLTHGAIYVFGILYEFGELCVQFIGQIGEGERMYVFGKFRE